MKNPRLQKYLKKKLDKKRLDSRKAIQNGIVKLANLNDKYYMQLYSKYLDINLSQSFVNLAKPSEEVEQILNNLITRLNQ